MVRNSELTETKRQAVRRAYAISVKTFNDERLDAIVRASKLIDAQKEQLNARHIVVTLYSEAYCAIVNYGGHVEIIELTNELNWCALCVPVESSSIVKVIYALVDYLNALDHKSEVK